MGQFVAKTSLFKYGFNGSFKSLHSQSKTQNFENNKIKYIVFNTIIWLFFGIIALGINFYYGATGGGGHFKKYGMEKQCADFVKNLKGKSMINLWMFTDIAICLVSMPALAINHYMDKNLYWN
jgi:hypothetical protein